MAEIWSWIAVGNGIARADAVLSRLLEACAVLAGNPVIGRERPDAQASVRSFPVAPHVILYRPTDRGVRVLRVVHGARDLPRALREGATEEPG